ncbi:type II secretion system F family protein [Phenylobacterium sp.]|uniref:type II secretion system F family protein n=1 Tax=Phenylobacterium sp. TaxID=1871053 RepID=UPI002721E0BF|nr:type II secretion system F family protein [Phenylobacterium sp.]MDO8381347.1 type II secretion system F family protein [Phenylobacterium sp.]
MLTIIVAVLAFITIAGLGFAFAGGDSESTRATKRAQALVSGGSGESRVRGGRTPANSPEARRKAILKTLKDQDRRQKKATLSIAARLQQAGLTFTEKQFWIASAVFGLVIGALSLPFGRSPLIALGLAFAAGLGLPRWVVGFIAKGRMKKFTEAFSDAIDIIVRGIKSGLPVHDCLKIIGKESPEPLAGEFRRLVENVAMGLAMDQALEKMYERMPTNELRFFAIVLAIQQKTGGNLAEALNNLSVVLRGRKLMREKIKALSSEAIASSFIIGSLPPGVVTLISITSPKYMAPLFTDPRGHLMLMGAVFWMSLGIFVMRKMINFKF